MFRKKTFSNSYQPIQDPILTTEITPDDRLVGYSLSFCIRDILSGKVSEAQVQKIIAGTAFRWWQLKNVLVSYCQSYWDENPSIAIKIFLRLYLKRKIYQPRLNGEPPPQITKGYWSRITN